MKSLYPPAVITMLIYDSVGLVGSSSFLPLISNKMCMEIALK